VSRRAELVSALADAGPGAAFTFAELAGLLGLDPDQDRTRLRFAIAAARPDLLRDHMLAIVADRGAGYRLALPGEHADLARRAREASDRRIGQAVTLVEYTDLDALTLEQREAHAKTRRAVLLLAHAHAQLAQRVEQQESRLAELERAVFGGHADPPADDGHEEAAG
jgi:hypothetical protein